MKLNQPIKLLRTVILAVTITVFTSEKSRGDTLPVITSGHTDVGVNYEDDAWDLHVHAEDLGEEFAPDAVWIKVGTGARTSVPLGEAYGFLGTAGAPLWVLPATHQDGLVYLGFGTEEMASGIFMDDTVNLSLQSVEGPGDFIVYINDMFGNPVVWYNSRDGLDTNDVHSLTAGGHSHVNWVFTVPGQYHIHFQASGILKSTGEMTTSSVADYLFDVGNLPQLQLSKNAEGLVLTWNSETNAIYQIQSRADLTLSDWQNYGNSVSGTGGQISMPLTNDTQCLFFRVEAKYLSTN